MSASAAVIVALAALGLFAWIGWRAGRAALLDRDAYLAARGSQPAGPLALSFLASGLGAWILFTPAEVGTFGGILGVTGYAVAAGLPFVVMALVGPRVRARLPAGITLTDFVRFRFGRPFQAYVSVVSVFYMVVFLTAELTAIGGVLALLSGVSPLVPIVAVTAVTTAYTAYGGLPASLRTDRWQAWMILALLAIGVGAVTAAVADPVGGALAGGLTSFTEVGAESFVVLAVAVTAANFFHQGYWQRLWASRDDASLVRGALGGALLTVPVMLLVGLMGMIAAGAGLVDVPSLALFSLLTGLAPWLVGLVVALAVALVASSVDTLQNALAATVAEDVGRGGLSLGTARWATVLLTVPAAAVAVLGLSVLRLFLIADLLAAATVVPVVLGLWRRARPGAALAGAVSGLAAVVVLGWVTRGGLAAGVHLLTLPSTAQGGLDLGAFLVAPAASGLVAWLGSLVRPARRAEEPVAG